MAICSGSNIWDDRMNCFARFCLESTVIKFLLVNKEIKVISGKSKFVEAESLTPRWTHCCFSVFLLFVLTVKCIFCQKWKVPLSERRWTVCRSFKINTTSWVLHLTKKMSEVLLLVVYFSYRPWYVLLFLMGGMTGAGWCYRSGTLSTLFGNAP